MSPWFPNSHFIPPLPMLKLHFFLPKYLNVSPGLKLAKLPYFTTGSKYITSIDDRSFSSSIKPGRYSNYCYHQHLFWTLTRCRNLDRLSSGRFSAGCPIELSHTHLFSIFSSLWCSEDCCTWRRVLVIIWVSYKLYYTWGKFLMIVLTVLCLIMAGLKFSKKCSYWKTNEGISLAKLPIFWKSSQQPGIKINRISLAEIERK